MLPSTVFGLLVAVVSPVFATAIPSPELAGSEATKRAKPGNYCHSPTEHYASEERDWAKWTHCIYVNPDQSAELFTYINDYQYKNAFIWHRPSKYDWIINARWDKPLITNFGKASGTDVKIHVGKISPRISPGINQYRISLHLYSKEGHANPAGNFQVDINIPSE